MSSPPSLERIVEYFERSRFDYLALDYGGKSLRLLRELREGGSAIDQAAGSAIGAAAVMNVLAPTIGFVEAAAGRTRFPKAGDAVEKDEALFTLRRHKAALTVHAAAGGMLESVRVAEGEFVEFGQPLATLSQAN